MKIKKNRKLTNKDLGQMLNELKYNQMLTQSHVTNLMEIFNEFLEFTHKKAKFMEHLHSKTEKVNTAKEEKESKQQPVTDDIV